MNQFLGAALATFLVALTPAAFAQYAGGGEVVILHTKSGPLVIELFQDDAPGHAENFLTLARDGHYDGTVFHRIIEGFMVQGGDPATAREDSSTLSWGSGGPGYMIDAEFNDIKHNRGIVSMARSSDPDSAGSQFFIVHADSNFLDGSYTVFGRLATAESFATLDRIATMDTPASLGEAPSGAPGADLPVNWKETAIERVEIVRASSVPGLLESDAPARTGAPVPEITSADTETDLGISFTPPAGWETQRLSNANPSSPDVSIIGPAVGVVPPSIYIAVAPADGQSLAEYKAEVDMLLQRLADSGQATMSPGEATTLDGIESYTRDVSTSLLLDNGDPIEIQFREINTIYEDRIYTITYAAETQIFDQFLPEYESMVNSISFDIGTDPDAVPQDGGGCLIATAAFGSEMSSQVQQLRELRDGVVLQTGSGRAFMDGFNQIYYSFSPAVADLEREHPVFREMARTSLTPMLASLSLLNHAGIDSEAELIGYGLGVILLNIGVYLAPPATLLYIWRRPTTNRRLRPNPDTP